MWHKAPHDDIALSQTDLGNGMVSGGTKTFTEPIMIYNQLSPFCQRRAMPQQIPQLTINYINLEII